MAETWKEFFVRKLSDYNDDWSEDDELTDALCEIMEQEL